ncbi:hypothetical protein K488DRAFT_92624 [Vararia minispora EC-137]|uniref:Uncharacterized protein n=1 Tax=Vararia minispora EC-137 TaxID=1314806 RepID=A0ACB8Q489_9AGAM|nr:hypothetical protein K488DRAFT_92624 [Vararia minispora EC-137]
MILQLPDDETFIPDRYHAVDGGDSYKCNRTAGKADNRIFESDLWLSRDFVDTFANEVRTRPMPRNNGGVDRGQDLNGKPEDGYILRDDRFITEEDDRCGENWAAANERELTPASKEVFDQTGIVACVCRHGHVEFAVEMVQSGELTKYALAVIAEILRIYGPHQALGVRT